MTETIFLQLQSNRRITLPAENFKKGDLVMIKKVTRVEMDNFMLDLQKKDERTVINSFTNEATGE